MAKLTAVGYVKVTLDHEPTKTLAKSQIKRCTKIDVTIYADAVHTVTSSIKNCPKGSSLIDFQRCRQHESYVPVLKHPS